MAEPDPQHMTTFCREVVPEFLQEVCQVQTAEAQAICDDILGRAEAFAALDQRSQQDVLITPFIEEVFDHEPLDAPLELKAAVTVVVRNSKLEEVHVQHLVNADGLRALTRMAAGPLSHLLAARRRDPLPVPGDSPFTDLDTKYPRAWTCLSAVAETFASGGRSGYRAPEAPVPDLPSSDEHAAARQTDEGIPKTVFSAIDPRFDHHLIEVLQQVTTENIPIFVPALSRFSRNSDKLMRVVEFLLAHGVTILTTNYMLRPQDVWVRRRQLVKPDSYDPSKGLRDIASLSGAHRAAALQVLAGVEEE
ncbi:hypothetical protein BZB76_0072 [Actinomadura pelletieri DSM 43383]|uniref:Uncharacterized protein n=1 Tax=Actinomadura pelletieri DSM 43383 TaxID=1120940 RepID=A0A495QX19_9ACTN|nr:recombinase family protein [Actinomadura pelletieri]RKS78653.1 hypothetical protein BZB76_0072 [Actinomadura pelletieri DSM 43383]